MKNADRIKFIQDQNAKREAAQKNNGSKNNGLRPNKAIVSASGSSAALVQANLNLTSRMACLFQPRAQINASVAFMRTSTPAPTTSGLWLSKEEMEKLKKFKKCFNCKQERHPTFRCTQPTRPYLAVNALLQKIMPMEDNASESEKV